MDSSITNCTAKICVRRMSDEAFKTWGLGSWRGSSTLISDKLLGHDGLDAEVADSRPSTPSRQGHGKSTSRYKVVRHAAAISRVLQGTLTEDIITLLVTKGRSNGSVS